MKHTLRLRLILSAALAFFEASALAKGPAKAIVQVSSVKDKGSKKLIFKTIANEGLVVNAEGPWHLEIKDAKGIKPTAMDFKRSDWKQDIAGFEVPLAEDSAAKSAEVQYKLTAFICTKEKTQCYREVIEGKATVTL